MRSFVQFSSFFPELWPLICLGKCIFYNFVLNSARILSLLKQFTYFTRKFSLHSFRQLYGYRVGLAPFFKGAGGRILITLHRGREYKKLKKGGGSMVQGQVFLTLFRMWGTKRPSTSFFSVTSANAGVSSPNFMTQF